VYLHYSHDGQPWNSIPGTAFAASTNASFPASQGWWFVEVAGNEVTWVTTNGQGQWDNNNGRNYQVRGGGCDCVMDVEWCRTECEQRAQVNSPGIYSLENGQVTTIATFPPGCPQENGQTCDGHGVCNTTTYTCSCSSGYWGVTCDGVCPGAPSSICNGHGACDPTSGACDCYTGWATCGGSGANSTLCTTNVQTDPYNCGGCNVTCLPDPGGGVARATCANSTCTRVCVSGWTLCPDGNCYEGSTCPLPGCDTFDVPGTQCVGDNITMPVSLEAARWQTPVRGSAEWLPGFQDYAFLVGHMQLVYSADHQWVNASVVALTRFSNVTLQASFNGSAFSPQLWATFAAPASGPISVVVRGSDGSVLALDEFDFIWDHPAVVPQDPSGDYRSGTKGGIVELWGWPYDDIAQECQAIANAGWLGIKIPTPQEHLFSTEPFQNVMNPWFFSYQPVSLRLQGRFGNRTSLRNMINSCRSVGVRVYADAVLNHMVGSGNDYAALHRIDSGGSCVTWPNKTSTAADPAYFITQDFEFVPNPNTGLPPTQEFPAVPYGPLQFHCERALNSWNDPLDLNAGWLDGTGEGGGLRGRGGERGAGMGRAPRARGVCVQAWWTSTRKTRRRRRASRTTWWTCCRSASRGSAWTRPSTCSRTTSRPSSACSSSAWAARCRWTWWHTWRCSRAARPTCCCATPTAGTTSPSTSSRRCSTRDSRRARWTTSRSGPTSSPPAPAPTAACSA
jgi:hypothetical protein